MFASYSISPFSDGSRRIRVEGRSNVQKLRHYLRRLGIETSAPLHLEGTGRYIVRIRHQGKLSRSRLQQVLAGFPTAELHS
jgi:hypothetical protein